MTYTVGRSTDTRRDGCKVTATAKSGKYTIETDYLTDPERNTVRDAGRVQAEAEAQRDPELRLYVRFDPTVNGNGGGGAGTAAATRRRSTRSTGHPVLVSSDPVTATNAANRDYAAAGLHRARRLALERRHERLRRRRERRAASARRATRSTPTYTDASDGNVVQTAQRRSSPKRRQDRCSRSASARRRPRRSARPKASLGDRVRQGARTATARAGRPTTSR